MKKAITILRTLLKYSAIIIAIFEVLEFAIEKLSGATKKIEEKNKEAVNQ